MDIAAKDMMRIGGYAILGFGILFLAFAGISKFVATDVRKRLKAGHGNRSEGEALFNKANDSYLATIKIAGLCLSVGIVALVIARYA